MTNQGSEDDAGRMAFVRHQLKHFELADELVLDTVNPDSARMLLHVWVGQFESRPYDLSSLSMVMNMPRETVRRRIKSLIQDDLVSIEQGSGKRHLILVTEKFLARARSMADRGIHMVEKLVSPIVDLNEDSAALQDVCKSGKPDL